jgi:hypothetical protein
MDSRSRVVQLFNPSTRMMGSGFLLGDRLVLTARHVVVDSSGEGVPCRARRLDPEADREANRVVVAHPRYVGARGDDLALLEFTQSLPLPPGGLDWVGFGRVDRNDVQEPVECSAIGFPFATALSASVRDTHHLIGSIAAAGYAMVDELAVTVRTAVPAVSVRPDFGWGGMSGAALLVGPYLVGVLVRVNSAFKGDQLTAIPVTRLLAAPGVRQVLDAAGVEVGSDDLHVVSGPLRLQLSQKMSVVLRPPFQRTPKDLDRQAAPVRLLSPRRGLVPFVPPPALTTLTTWCAEGPRTGLVTLTGSSGSGKSRLASELCVHQLAAGWDAGEADMAMPAGRPRTDLRRPTLLVVDNAERQVDLIAALVDHLGPRQVGPHARILLLSRTREVWWEALHERTDVLADLCPDESLLAIDAGNYGLPLPQRERHRARAAEALGDALGLSREHVATVLDLVDVRAPYFANPLLIHMSVLLALTDPAAAGPALHGDVRNQVLHELLRHERRRWNGLRRQRFFKGLGEFDDGIAHDAVAVATLAAPATPRVARPVLRAVKDVKGRSRRSLVRWLHAAYPGEVTYIEPVRPDLLAEQLLDEVEDLERLLSRLVECAIDAEVGWQASGDTAESTACDVILTQLLAEATRAGDQRPAVRAAVGALLERHLDVLVERAVRYRQGGLPTVLTAALRLAPAPGQAAAVLNVVPVGGRLLGGLALELAEQGAPYLEQQPASDPAAVAEAWRLLAVWRAQAGRAPEALRAATHAVRWAGQLADEAATPPPVVPRSLDTLANRLADAGHERWALAAATRAADLFTLLAGGAAEYRADLARALSNLANRRAETGRLHSALHPARRSVQLYEELLSPGPDELQPTDPDHRLGYAEALNTLGVRLGAVLGNRLEAADVAERSVRVYQSLLKTDPDTYLPGLANALNTLAVRLSAVGSHTEALEAAESAVKFSRELMRDDRLTGTPRLAASLCTLANALDKSGHVTPALARGREATALYELLVGWRSDSYLDGLAGSLDDLSGRLARAGNAAEALSTARRATRAFEQLAITDPDTYLFRVVWSLRSLTARLDDVQQRDEALATAERAAALQRALTDEVAHHLPDWCRPDPASGVRRPTRRRRRRR